MGPTFFPLCKLFLAIPFFLPVISYAQPAFSCAVTANPAQVRVEGVTELLGDIVFQCNGGVPGSVLTGSLTLYLPVTVTNRIDSNGQTRDAVLSIDSGSGIAPSAVPGTVSGNSLSFYGLSFTLPAGSVKLQVSGIRAAVSQFVRPGQAVIASISSSFPVSHGQVIVANTQTGLTTSFYSSGITCVGSPTPENLDLASLFEAHTAFASTRLTEGYASAFEPRRAGQDNGVRFLMKYSGFPSNARIYIPDAVAGSGALVPTAGGDLGVPQAVGQYLPGSGTLVLVRVKGADSAGAGGLPVSPPQGSGPQLLNGVSEVPLANGSGYAVYEVADANPSIQETVQFPAFVTLPFVSAPAVASETVSLAPVSSTAAASATAPIVRFLSAPTPSDCTALGDCNAPYFPRLMVDAYMTTLTATEKGGPTIGQYQYLPINIRNGAGGVLSWNVSISYQTGSGWLVLDKNSGTGTGGVRVSPDTKLLTPGTYQATVTVNAGSAGTQNIPVTLNVVAAPPPPPPPAPTTPQPAIATVLNLATMSATPLARGSLATIIGTHLSGSDVAVTFDGVSATILFGSDNQINLQVPVAIGTGTVKLVVTVDRVASEARSVTVAAAWPSVFAHGVLNQDYTENSAAAPARPGDVLQVFVTGVPADAVLAVLIGGNEVLPLYAGAAPGLRGIQQVNLAVPADAAAGSPLILCVKSTGSEQYCSEPYLLSIVAGPGL
jgi:uncharacterized protein (TIGR03437 family)